MNLENADSKGQNNYYFDHQINRIESILSLSEEKNDTIRKQILNNFFINHEFQEYVFNKVDINIKEKQIKKSILAMFLVKYPFLNFDELSQ